MNRKAEHRNRTAYLIAAPIILVWNLVFAWLTHGFWRGWSVYSALVVVAVMVAVELGRWRTRALDRRIARGYARMTADLIAAHGRLERRIREVRAPEPWRDAAQRMNTEGKRTSEVEW
jgi:uncharacterized membrane protein YraQ (UPF0718 family)